MAPIETIMRTAPVIPVLVIEDAAHAVPIARALVKGGLRVLEVTLRTPCALDAIRAMSEVEGGVVGAGTLLTPADVKAAKAAGATFGVSPGATERLIDACIELDFPLLRIIDRFDGGRTRHVAEQVGIAQVTDPAEGPQICFE